MINDVSAELDSQRRRYRLLMFVEVLLLFATWGLVRIFAAHKWKCAACLFGLLGVWHVAVIPICFLYLIGRPIVMTLSPLIPSAESRAFRRTLRQRPVLSDDEFHSRFYAGSEIPRDTLVRLRRCLSEIDTLIDRVVPSDSLQLLDDDLDIGDLLWLAEQELGTHFDKSDFEHVDGTLDNLVRLVQSKISPGLTLK